MDVLASAARPDLRATCIDIDPEALAYAASAARAHGVGEFFAFARDNVIHLAEGRGRTPLAPQHLIYSVGLTDYFDDAQVIALLDWTYSHLVPGGRVVIGNFGPSNPNKFFMDHVVHWRLIHRAADELRALFERSRFGGSDVTVRAEDSGVNLFAICQK